ncbi:calcium-binding protein [Thalassovita aquimarina]|uniref:Calcium-binding protein n=1 Tax=Thalassovita aquimarina TaxID=2785917 RepID=A0ABS5HNE4_9RHOB|nr:calcium-binding protein [Thalassovita aquimarina]MBR9650098.1 hypothetical protein [Thalassovita aquimarina]
MLFTFAGSNDSFFQHGFFDLGGSVGDYDARRVNSTVISMLNNDTGVTFSLYSSHFTYNQYSTVSPITGTIHTMTFDQEGIEQGSVRDVDWEIMDFLRSLDSVVLGNFGPLAGLINQAGEAAGGITITAENASAAFDMGQSWNSELMALITSKISIDGSAYADVLLGATRGDDIRGNDGNDTIWGNEGHDTIDGGLGRDRIYLNQGNDLFIDNVQGGDIGSDTVYGGFGDDTIQGGNGGDNFQGQAGNDLIHGRKGDDLIAGGNDLDTIFGGDGFDTIWAGKDDDLVNGGNGRDLVHLNQGDDLYIDNSQGGFWGRDTVFGGFGADTIQGGNGDDAFHGEADNDLIFGRLGNDMIRGGTGFDTIHGGDGNDTVYGDYGRDRIFMGNGDDTYVDSAQGGNLGQDTINGGAGADTFVFGAAIASDTIVDFEVGTDVLQLTEDLWGGGQSAAQVLSNYASVTADGVLFDFGSGQSILLAGLSSVAGLEGDILLL